MGSLVHTSSQMLRVTQDSLKMGLETGGDTVSTSMGVLTKDSGKMDWSTEMECSLSQTGILLLESFLTTMQRVQECITTRTVLSTQATLKETWCMEQETWQSKQHHIFLKPSAYGSSEKGSWLNHQKNGDFVFTDTSGVKNQVLYSYGALVKK